ncbi:MAG: diguanylate cyclase [Synechococcales cyanobacterium RU_4_20]|nr:diguanylate cyclase [Synechococcales cyanobacterium RU_4_20]
MVIDEDIEPAEALGFVNSRGIAPHSVQASSQHPLNFDRWKVVIIDDEPAVHQATQLALRNFMFEGKPLELISAYSGEEGKALITRFHSDIAFILLDVVMESEDAGLKVVRYVRDELHNHQVRIILRTGQPGEAPEESVILDYDINDYQLKVELTRQRLLTTVLSALRSFRDIVTIEQQRGEIAAVLERMSYLQEQLKEYSYSLEIKVSQRTADLERANRKLHRLAHLDGLTQVANRRWFDEYLQEQWHRLAQDSQPLSLLIADVDYFKGYNDRYGHQAGDECLKQFAQVLKAIAARPEDLVARYGGEEFVILLPKTPLEGACRLAEKSLAALRQLCLPHATSEVADRVTMSLGVSWLIPQPEVPLKSLVEMADRALYRAKQQGRDRYCVYPADSP